MNLSSFFSLFNACVASGDEGNEDVISPALMVAVADLDWMSVNWPKLKTIRGLESKREWTGDAAGGLAIKAAVDPWMADHPDGIGSYFSGTKR